MMKKICAMMAVLAFSIFFTGCDQTAIEATMPADLAAQEEITQEYLDAEVEEGLYNEAELNEDGSVTYKMSVNQHETILADMEMIYQDSFDEMVDPDESTMVSIEANDDYSSFQVVMPSAELPINEAFVTDNLIYMGRMYAVYNWTDPDEICVTYIDQTTGDTIAEKTFKYE